jgi:deoxyhypusine synthase
MLTTGFQATNLGRAINEINRMRSYRLSDVPYREGIDDESLRDPTLRSKIRARIFLAYTSNQISCGQREVIRYLVQHGMVDVVVTTAGGVEEDIVKCLERTYMGDFNLDGRELRKRGINRIGNLLVPNKNYCKFEDWLSPLLDRLHDEQDDRWLAMARKVASTTSTSASSLPEEMMRPYSITPSEFISRLGKEINDETSVLYWAHRNSIPVFCPALTDGSIGDMIYFHSYKRSGFTLDIARDIRNINDLAVRSHATGQIIIGGGIVKHHTCNANLMRNGADYSVYVNTGHEFDGSDSGASPEEAISWGKIRITADPVKVCADATIVFPLLVSQTFARDVDAWRESTRDCICWIDD